MAAPLILARTFRDAHAYAQDTLGLRIGYYRVVNSVGTVKAVRGVDLHLVPGWDKRPDRFSIKSALKYSKGRLNIIDAAEPVESPFVEVDGVLTTRGAAEAIAASGYPLNERTHAVALRYNAMRDSNTLETESDVVGDFFADVTPEAPEPTATCVDCGLDDHAPDCSAKPEGWMGVADAADLEPPVVDHQQGELNLAPEPEAPTEKPKARRRSKCKNCEQLHYKDEPCVDSEAV